MTIVLLLYTHFRKLNNLRKKHFLYFISIQILFFSIKLFFIDEKFSFTAVKLN